MDGCAGVAGMRADYERSIRLAGAAAALRETVGQVLPLGRQERHERRMQRAREAVGPAATAAVWAERVALNIEQAIAEALDERPSHASAPNRSGGDDR